MEVIVECLLVNMQIISLETDLSHSLRTKCLSSGRRWYGKSFINSCCENALLFPLAADGSFMDRPFHIPHTLWVEKFFCHFYLSKVLSYHVHESLLLYLLCRWQLATLLDCLLRTLDHLTHTEQTLISTFKGFFPYECGKIQDFIPWFFFCVFVHVYSLAHSFQIKWAVVFWCSLTVNSKLFIWTIFISKRMLIKLPLPGEDRGKSVRGGRKS